MFAPFFDPPFSYRFNGYAQARCKGPFPCRSSRAVKRVSGPAWPNAVEAGEQGFTGWGRDKHCPKVGAAERLFAKAALASLIGHKIVGALSPKAVRRLIPVSALVLMA